MTQKLILKKLCCHVIEEIYETLDIKKVDTNRLLHRKCPIQIFIHESQNFRNERVVKKRSLLRNLLINEGVYICWTFIQRGKFALQNQLG